MDENEQKEETLIPQQHISQDNIHNENNNENEIQQFVEKDLDSTIEDIKEKKQKEREDKLADMMSHYHKKYSSPSLESLETIANDNGEIISDNIISPNQHKRSLSATKKKEDLAEQMKKYNDQFGSIISSVNSILSSPSSNNSSNNNSPINSSPILTSTQPLETVSSELNLCNNNKNNEVNDNNNNSQLNQTSTLLPEVQPQSQPPPNPLLNFENILFFEHQDIPMLTNVGFKTLKSIEMDAMKCSESLIHLTKSLNYSLQMMTKMSVELFHAYRVSNESLSQSVGNSIHETEIMIHKCKELNDHTRHIHTLHQKIRIIKDNINRFEAIILNIVKQASIHQQK